MNVKKQYLEQLTASKYLFSSIDLCSTVVSIAILNAVDTVSACMNCIDNVSINRKPAKQLID